MPDPSTHPTTVRAELAAATLSLVVGVILLGVKFTTYLITESSAVFSDALESIVNVVAAGFALWAIRLAHQPADREHPYGHGKVEFISAALEGGMILLAGVAVMIHAIDQWIRSPRVNEVGIGIALVALTMFINGAVGTFLIRRGKRSGSMILEADGKHLLADAITSAAALIALLIIKFTGFVQADPIAAILVGVYLCAMSLRLLRRASGGLMDEQDLADDQMLRALLDSHIGTTGKSPMICGYHKLRHRHTGRYHWIDFHLHVPADYSTRQGHEVASAIEKEIEDAFGGEGDATAHVEPCEDLKCACQPTSPS